MNRYSWVMVFSLVIIGNFCMSPEIVYAADSELTLPGDIDPISLSRLPVIQRKDMDEDGKRIYDMLAGDDGKAPLMGPGGVSLHSPKVAEAMHMLNQYLRYNSIIGRRYTEVVILVAARVFDQGYEWAAHEPIALDEGAPQAVIDTIKYNREVKGLSEQESLIIRYGREIFRQHSLSPELFAEAVELFGQKGAFEIAAIMGDYVMAGVMLHAVDQHIPADRKARLSVDK